MYHCIRSRLLKTIVIKSFTIDNNIFSCNLVHNLFFFIEHQVFFRKVENLLLVKLFKFSDPLMSCFFLNKSQFFLFFSILNTAFEYKEERINNEFFRIFSNNTLNKGYNL